MKTSVWGEPKGIIGITIEAESFNDQKRLDKVRQGLDGHVSFPVSIHGKSYSGWMFHWVGGRTKLFQKVTERITLNFIPD